MPHSIHQISSPQTIQTMAMVLKLTAIYRPQRNPGHHRQPGSYDTLRAGNL